MTRIVEGGEVYEDISSSYLSEKQFEKIVIQESDTLYPEYYAVQFKKTVSSEEGKAEADMALVHKGYKEWWVVEVEMSRHSLGSHVVPQVTKLSRAEYGPAEAQYLSSQSADLSEDRMLTLMKGSPPGMLIIVDEAVPDWSAALNPHDVSVAYFQVFRSERNSHAFYVRGDHPSPPGEVVTRCRATPHVHRLVEVDSPAAEALRGSETFNILHDGRITKWVKQHTADTVFLRCKHSNPLEPQKEYKILRKESGKLEFSS